MYSLQNVINNETILVSIEEKLSDFKISKYNKVMFWDNINNDFILYDKSTDRFDVIDNIDFMGYKPLLVSNNFNEEDNEVTKDNIKYLNYLIKKYKVVKLLKCNKNYHYASKRLDCIIAMLDKYHNDDKLNDILELLKTKNSGFNF